MVGCVHLRMCAPQVFRLSEDIMEIVQKREKWKTDEEKKEKENEKEYGRTYA